MDRKERALKIIDLLKEEYPDASSSLDYKRTMNFFWRKACSTVHR